jgi:hypothetical protein
MKKLFIPLLAGLLLSCVQSPAQDSKETDRAEKKREREEKSRARIKEKYPEESKEHISKQFSLQKSTGAILAIYNLAGSIKVEGYAGDKVMIEMDKTIAAKTKDILEQAKKEVKLEFEQIGDSIVAYMSEPWDTRPHDWSSWDNNHDRNRHIDYNCDVQYIVKVPFNMSLNVSTVNNGEVVVKDVAGKLNVGNVNGGIEIINAKGTTHAHTVNGDLTVNYLTNPSEASSFYTLNGKLTATFQANLSADMEFKTMNGAFYTDFPDVEVLPQKVNITKDNKSQGTLYRINKNSDVRIGSGGKLFKFETLNGNIYIQKQS